MAAYVYGNGKYHLLAGNKVAKDGELLPMKATDRIVLDGKTYNLGNATIPDTEFPQIPGATLTELTHEQGEEPASGRAWYISPDGSGAKDGTSWENAADPSLIQVILLSCVASDRICFMEGEYSLERPMSIASGVSLYGGFNSADTSWAARDAFNHPTIMLPNGYSGTFAEVAEAVEGQIIDGFTLGGFEDDTEDGASLIYQNMNISGGRFTTKGKLYNCYISNCPLIAADAEKVIVSTAEAKNMTISGSLLNASVDLSGGILQIGTLENCYTSNSSIRGTIINTSTITGDVTSNSISESTITGDVDALTSSNNKIYASKIVLGTSAKDHILNIPFKERNYQESNLLVVGRRILWSDTLFLLPEKAESAFLILFSNGVLFAGGNMYSVSYGNYAMTFQLIENNCIFLDGDIVGGIYYVHENKIYDYQNLSPVYIADYDASFKLSKGEPCEVNDFFFSYSYFSRLYIKGGNLYRISGEELEGSGQWTDISGAFGYIEQKPGDGVIWPDAHNYYKSTQYAYGLKGKDLYIIPSADAIEKIGTNFDRILGCYGKYDKWRALAVVDAEGSFIKYSTHYLSTSYQYAYGVTGKSLYQINNKTITKLTDNCQDIMSNGVWLHEDGTLWKDSTKISDLIFDHLYNKSYAVSHGIFYHIDTNDNTVTPINSLSLNDVNQASGSHFINSACSVSIAENSEFINCENENLVESSAKFCTFANCKGSVPSGTYNIFWNCDGTIPSANNTQSTYYADDLVAGGLGTDNTIARFTNTGFYPAQGMQDVGQPPSPITDPTGYQNWIEQFGDFTPASNSFLKGKAPLDSTVPADIEGTKRLNPSTPGAYEALTE